MTLQLSELTEDQLAEIEHIINVPGYTWKIRRNLLRHKFGIDGAQLEILLPTPPNGEFWPSDY